MFVCIAGAWMAQDGVYIDLKDTYFYLEDGYSEVGAVNKEENYTKGVTSIIVDGFTVALDPGLPIVFTGDPIQYTLVSTVETSDKTTTIVITPATNTALTNDQVVTAGPHRLRIKVGDGNLTYTRSQPREYKLDRGRLDQARNGDETPMDVATTFAWTYISSATNATVPTIEEFLDRTGPASDYVSTSTDPCEPYAVDIVLVKVPPSCSGVTNSVEVIRFPEFRWESQPHDAKAGTVQLTGKCNALRPTITRQDSWYE